MEKINIFFEDIPVLKLPKKKIFEFVKEIILKENYSCGNINIILCKDDFLIKINKQYLRHDYYTDILTFDFSENLIISGDLYISYERIRENASTYNNYVYDELIRVIIHGILHLLGYTDKLKKEIKIMREKENEYLLQFLKNIN
jgi:probable rRNA maturation factor